MASELPRHFRFACIPIPESMWLLPGFLLSLSPAFDFLFLFRMKAFVQRCRESFCLRWPHSLQHILAFVLSLLDIRQPDINHCIGWLGHSLDHHVLSVVSSFCCKKAWSFGYVVTHDEYFSTQERRVCFSMRGQVSLSPFGATLPSFFKSSIISTMV